MNNIFNIIPTEFFNCLGSNSSQKIHADCLQLIYQEYEREVSYRIPRNRIRDTLAIYLSETHAEFFKEENIEGKSASDKASELIRKYVSKKIGWLEEEVDETTYEKQIVMTENGIALAEFLSSLEKHEQEEFSSYIFNIYNTLNNPSQWKDNPYVNGIKNIYKNAKNLSKSLKKLSTFIRKIIEKMVQEKTLESLTENVLEYCDGNFIKEYSRLTKQQNIHIYRMFIRTKLDMMLTDEEIFISLIEDCIKEEKLCYDEAQDKVLDMIQSTKRFLVEDYDRIMKDIKHKINLYFQIAIGRARFIRNKEKNILGNVEKTLFYIIEEMNDLDAKDTLPDEMNMLFTISRNEFIDKDSIRLPQKRHSIKNAIAQDLEELTEEQLEKARREQTSEAYNPYSIEKMKAYINNKMGDKKELLCKELPLNNKHDLLKTLAAFAYSIENGFSVEILDGYYEAHNMIIRNFKISKEE